MPAAKSAQLRERALVLLGEGQSVRAVAAMLGVGKSTVAEWRLRMGDSPGHDFHGNQWTGGMGGTLADSHNPALVSKLDVATNELLPLTRERAYVLTRDGSVVAKTNGTEGSVSFNPGEVGVIATAALPGGAVALHNHPSGYGTSFSPVDVATGFRFGFNEVRVAAKPWIYVMRPGKLATPSGQFPKGSGRDIVDRAEEVYAQGQRGATGTSWHDVWSQVASEKGLEYFRVAVGDTARNSGYVAPPPPRPTLNALDHAEGARA